MISKDFSAPTGSGIRKLLVAPEALAVIAGTDRRITVIVAAMVVAEVNWKKALPNATYLTAQAWMRRAKDADTDLIIVDELSPLQRVLVTSTLERIAAEVWTVNHKQHDAPSALEVGIAVHTHMLTAGINPPDVSGFITGNGDSSFVPHDFEGWGPLAMAAAHGFNMHSLTIRKPAAIIMTDSAPCAGHSKPTKRTSETDISKLLASMFKPGALRCIKLPARTSFRQHLSKERAIKARCALAHADIKAISTDELDQLLAPYMGAGLVRTAYERSTGATEYRSPTGRLMAMTIGATHFRPAATGVSDSIALYAQTFGRIKRQPRTVHAFLENPLTGEKIEGSDFTVGGAK